MKAEHEKMLMEALGVGATVSAGYTYTPVNNFLDTLPVMSSNTAVNPNGAKNGKAIKTTLATIVAIGLKIGAPKLDNDGLEKMVNLLGDHAAGLGAAIWAADPVITSYPATSAGVPAGQAPAQRVVRSGNLMS